MPAILGFRRWRWQWVAGLALAVMTAACTTAQAPASLAPTIRPSAVVLQPTPAVTEAVAPTSGRPDCPNPDGGACLGPMAAGTYTSSRFKYPVTYTVPAGWTNFEDLPGSVAFVPPGGDVAGVDAGTSDAVGIAASVAADSPDCSTQPEPGLGFSAKDIAEALAKRAGLTTTKPEAVTVGGLEGYVLDIRLAKGWTKSACSGEGKPDVPLLIGRPPSDFENTALGGVAIRLYLLDHGEATTAIEIDDVSGGGRIAEYMPLIEALKFGP